jgi:lauroyl/myristoyl acyltransferase
MSGGFFMPAIPIPFMEIPTAIMALGILGFELAQGVSTLVTAKRQQVVDHVLVNENGLRIGVRQTKEGKLELLVDEDELREKEGMELKDFHQEVQKQYQYVQLMERLKAEGYTVVEETEEANETVRLVVRRWR